jgi:hypothetical protein
MKRCGLTQRVAFTLALARFFAFFAYLVCPQYLVPKRHGEGGYAHCTQFLGRVWDEFGNGEWREYSRRLEPVNAERRMRLVKGLLEWLRALTRCSETRSVRHAAILYRLWFRSSL